MALFVDGPGCTIEDLVAQDGGLLSASESEGISVTAKIQLAAEEMMPEIQLWLDRPRPSLQGIWHSGLVLEQVVWTPALKRWQVMQALTLFYRDAYFSHLVDRFQAKWDEYARLTRVVREQFVSAGLAMVMLPARRAAAPVLDIASGSQTGGTLYAAVSYLNAKGQEGEASEISSLVLSDGSLLKIGTADAVASWNVYAGTSLDDLRLQNSAPLCNGDTWIYVPGAVRGTSRPSIGQAPDFVVQLSRTWMRG